MQAEKTFKKVFLSNYNAFNDLKNTNNKNSRRLLLFYCVECGLKYLIMKKKGIHNTKIKLFGHDIEALITEAGITGEYDFRPFNTRYGNPVDIATYHQFCRYSIPIKGDVDDAPMRFEEELKKIAAILKEEV